MNLPILSQYSIRSSSVLSNVTAYAFITGRVVDWGSDVTDGTPLGYDLFVRSIENGHLARLMAMPKGVFPTQAEKGKEPHLRTVGKELYVALGAPLEQKDIEFAIDIANGRRSVSIPGTSTPCATDPSVKNFIGVIEDWNFHITQEGTGIFSGNVYDYLGQYSGKLYAPGEMPILTLPHGTKPIIGTEDNLFITESGSHYGLGKPAAGVDIGLKANLLSWYSKQTQPRPGQGGVHIG